MRATCWYANGMTQPQRVIYLPPGMVPGQATPTGPAPSTGIPFDRVFFEQVLPQSIQGFCHQVDCPAPVVEVLTVDGSTHFVAAISGVSDNWVALQTASEEHQHPVQVFLPYNTIFRVEVHPEPDNGRGHLGFVLASAANPPTVVPARTSNRKKK